MQSSRLKNIIILILLLTNLSLAAVVVSRQADHQEGLEHFVCSGKRGTG